MKRQSWHLTTLFYWKVWKTCPKITIFVLWNPFIFPPDHLRNPILGQVVQFYGLYKWYEGFYMIFSFSAVTQPEMEKFCTFCRFLRFFHTFSYSGLCIWLKNKNHEKCYKTFVWLMKCNNLAKNGIPQLIRRKNKWILTYENGDFWSRFSMRFFENVCRCHLWRFISQPWIKIFQFRKMSVQAHN